MMPFHPSWRALTRTRLDLRAPLHPGQLPLLYRSSHVAERGEDALGRDPAAPRHRVERDALAEQEAPRRALDGRDLDLGRVVRRRDGGAFCEVPLDAAGGARVRGELRQREPRLEHEEEREEGTHVQPSWAKISSTKGTPARTPCAHVQASQLCPHAPPGGEDGTGRTSLLPHSVASSIVSPTTNPP